MENKNYIPPYSAGSTAAPADPAIIVLETMARLRVLECLLQRAVVAEIATGEHRALLIRYNRQRQEIFDRLDGTPARMLPTPAQLQELLVGPLAPDSAGPALASAIVNVRRMMELLTID
ncbi:MAG: hypothetical protein A2091_03570 [Desulfuromonadales bacterium GWD2_61_12]|nr:MAG: hypothetical protein A2091_03570 [Desulfuromonadales bacterium GWD2_61_12]OGR33515.1 MAG: hypothetical protein A2005_08110 [Desulfuromonadales bacterium GWC2_61_20]HAD03228.1 hypothetical protein [Desulfuromonas sp.]HBT83107.1 hypothetical protein [Desulfuromonas sp.]